VNPGELEDFTRQRIQASIDAKQALLNDAALIAQLSEVVERAIRVGRKLIVFGNGGSAADAQHIAAELIGHFYIDRPSLPAVALTVNTSSLTAIGNDYSYDLIFARQLEGIGREGDVAIGISTSGNSANVLEAVKAARRLNVTTIGFTGRGGGKLKDVVDFCLRVQSDDVARIQESHILVGHIICEHVEAALYGKT
jgi:D-sedoheptulose 7-phosphate isomerase